MFAAASTSRGTRRSPGCAPSASAARAGSRVRAIAMRDTDRDLTSVIVVRSDAGIKTAGRPQGKTVAVGAIDSPQATLIPLDYLRDAGSATRQRLHGASLRRARRQARRPRRRRARCGAGADGRRTRRRVHDRRQPPAVRRRRHAARRPHARARRRRRRTTTATSPSPTRAPRAQIERFVSLAAVDVLRRRRGAAAARSRRLEGVAAGPHQRLRAARERPSTRPTLLRRRWQHR